MPVALREVKPPDLVSDSLYRIVELGTGALLLHDIPGSLRTPVLVDGLDRTELIDRPQNYRRRRALCGVPLAPGSRVVEVIPGLRNNGGALPEATKDLTSHFTQGLPTATNRRLTSEAKHINHHPDVELKAR